MTTWLTADLHLSHARIAELANRPFPDVETMNRVIVDRFTAAVNADDVVYVLGDVAMGPIQDSLALCGSLPGTRHLVLGNHDRPFMRRGKPDEQVWVGRYLDEGGFASVIYGSHAIEVPGFGDVLLSHFPYTGDSHDTDRFVDDRPVDTGLWLLHGHTHAPDRIDRARRMVHVGVDAWDFAPVRLDDIVKLINGGA
jgi:calcineurin-like phosphoesterase family protein